MRHYIPSEDVLKRKYEKVVNANIKLVDENRYLKVDVEQLKERVTGEKNAYNRMYNMFTELQEKIDNAIEYIDRRDIEWGSEEHDKLLNILKGVDKE